LKIGGSGDFKRSTNLSVRENWWIGRFQAIHQFICAGKLVDRAISSDPPIYPCWKIGGSADFKRSTNLTVRENWWIGQFQAIHQFNCAGKLVDRPISSDPAIYLCRRIGGSTDLLENWWIGRFQAIHQFICAGKLVDRPICWKIGGSGDFKRSTNLSVLENWWIGRFQAIHQFICAGKLVDRPISSDPPIYLCRRIGGSTDLLENWWIGRFQAIHQFICAGKLVDWPYILDPPIYPSFSRTTRLGE